MARPRPEIGSHGEISVKKLPSGKWKARAHYRKANGRLGEIERTVASKAKVQIALEKAMTEIEENAGSISGGMKLSALADRFIKEKEKRRSPGTLQTYRTALTAHILPDIGDVKIREATPERMDNYIQHVAQEDGHGAAKNCRSVLSGMMSLAVRNGALSHNPLSEVAPIEKRKKPGSRPIPPEQLGKFLSAIEENETLQRRDVVEVLKLMAGTGLRMGEACGLKRSAIDFQKGELTMCRIAKYLEGKGAVIQEQGKTASSIRTIRLPESVLEMLRRRRERTEPNDLDLVFPSTTNGVRDPNNVERALREQREAIGFPGVTSHSLRKCVATILDASGMSTRDIADYLGHSKPSMTQDVYMQRNRDSQLSAQNLEHQIASFM